MKCIAKPLWWVLYCRWIYLYWYVRGWGEKRASVVCSIDMAVKIMFLCIVE